MRAIHRRTWLYTLAAAALGAASLATHAQGVVKVGIVTVLSGPFAEFGKQMESGVKIYQKEHGDSVAGHKVEVVFKDTGGSNPEMAKRLATELVTRDKAQVLGGFVFTPDTMAVAPIATQAKVPMIVMNAAGNDITSKSPYMLRTSFGFNRMVPPVGEWALKQGYKKAYVLVADYAPGHDVEKAFTTAYQAGGGTVLGSVRTPMTTLDFSPYMQRVKDAKPDVLFAFVNGGDVAPAFMKEFKDKGLADAGIKLIGTGDITDEPTLPAIGDKALDTVTVYPYSMDHRSELNRKFVQEVQAMRGKDARPTIMAVGAYDGMAVLYEALKKIKGEVTGEALLEAMKGVSVESPRGKITISATTRDVDQTQYIRRVERVNGGLANVEFAEFADKK
jgi:branched-chain amino acid transport system substrate-binding protein